MSRNVSIFSVVMVMIVTVLATVAVALAQEEPQGEGGGGPVEKVTLCHNLDHNPHLITVGKPAEAAHLAHGDTIVEDATVEDTNLENPEDTSIQENPEDTCGNAGALPEEPPEGTTPTLTTVASNSGTVEDPAATLPDGTISDTATLSSATNDATGTITFSAYGPFDPATDPTTDVCGGTTLAFESPDPVDIGSPDATSGDYVVSSDDPAVTTDDFVPDKAGRYQWIASYSSDDETKNVSVSTNCNDVNEQSLVSDEAGTTATEQNMTLAAEIGEAANPADPATDTTDIKGTTQNDNTTLGSDGDDDLIGDSSANVLLGRDGSDFLDGGTDLDRMVGGRKYDFINGADGKPGDVLNGGNGTDYCVGDVGDEFNNCDGNVVQVRVQHH